MLILLEIGIYFEVYSWDRRVVDVDTGTRK